MGDPLLPCPGCGGDLVLASDGCECPACRWCATDLPRTLSQLCGMDEYTVEDVDLARWTRWALGSAAHDLAAIAAACVEVVGPHDGEPRTLVRAALDELVALRDQVAVLTHYIDERDHLERCRRADEWAHVSATYADYEAEIVALRDRCAALESAARRLRDRVAECEDAERERERCAAMVRGSGVGHD